MHKDFAIKLANMLKDSGVKDMCLNFMHEHPEMFTDTFIGGSKIMSVDISVAVVADDASDISNEPGFITITLDRNNCYSEHFKSNSRYWNNEKMEGKDIVAIQK